MKNIKLVIWDLDETFWKGTLSEEGIEVIESNITLIKTLTKRGIVNSIASKNTYEDAKATLEKLSIWEYFVFPKIEWSAKGPLIVDIIKETQLRATDVLFIDDNHLNLKEASFYNPGINVDYPSIISTILNDPGFKGKDDIKLTRLKQYKILEEKAEAKKHFSDNSEFLKTSGINATISPIFESDIDRIHELIERTNQLNYTKVRSSKEELVTMLNDSELDCKKISVKDNFGDYGVIGLYVLRKHDYTLIHFVFSCRTINIGIEQFIYAHLSFPKVNIVESVTTQLENDYKPDWITLNAEDKIDEIITKQLSIKNTEKLSLLLKGGCDLEQMLHYFQYSNIQTSTEFNTVKNNIPLHNEHTVYVRRALENNKLKEDEYFLKEIPFWDESFLKTEISDPKYDLIVFSVLMDYTQKVFSSNHTSTKFAYGTYTTTLLDKIDNNKLPQYIDEKCVNLISQNCNSEAQITPDQFKENLSYILNKVNCPIIFINGVEQTSPDVDEAAAIQRHKVMNRALDEVVESFENAYLLDMRNLVTKNDLTNNIRHYKRPIYQAMSKELEKIVTRIFNQELKLNKKSHYFGKVKHLAKTVKQKLI